MAEHVFLKKGGRISKVESTNKRKIEKLQDEGFTVVEFGKKGEVIEKSENVTIDKLQKENTKLKAKIKELEALK